jgi:hypothetical protein
MFEHPETMLLFLIDDLLPMINLSVAFHTAYMCFRDLRKINDHTFRTIVILLMIGSALFGIAYFVVLIGADHLLDSDSSNFGSIIMRSITTYVIVVLNISARNRRFPPKEKTNDNNANPTFIK